MNKAIQEQLEARLAAYGSMYDEDVDAAYETLARECAALRSLCSEVVPWIEENATCSKMLWALRERLQAAAAGKDVAT